MPSDPPLHVALGPDLRRPSVRLLKVIPDLTIKRAQDIAQNMELADINAKELKADGQARFTDSVHLATTQRQEKRRPCYRCGRNHEADQCKFKEAKCHKCGKQGHIAPVCRTATTPPVDRPKRRPYQRRRAGGTKWLEAEMEQWDPLPLFVLSGAAPQPPILVTMSITSVCSQWSRSTATHPSHNVSLQHSCNL